MAELLLDTLLDSLKIFIFVFAVNFIFSFLEEKIAQTTPKKRLFAVPLGAALGLLPQCSFSVLACDNYSKRKISAGALIAVFIATSDEAIPVILAEPSKRITLIFLLISKFIIAVVFGYLFDALFSKKLESTIYSETSVVYSNNHGHSTCPACKRTNLNNVNSTEEDLAKNESNDGAKTFLHEHFLHPLEHSLKTFIAALLINLAFALIIYFVTEERLTEFLQGAKFFTPAAAALIGLIPNCSSSVLISKLYVSGSISFGACLSGLSANAGLGLFFLFKTQKNLKSSLFIAAYVIIISIACGYAFSLLSGF